MAVQALVIDSTIEGELGSDVLDRICDSLYPVDCQTCGAGLGDTPPAVWVEQVADGLAFAQLHHPTCQRPRWTSGKQCLQPRDEPLLSWRAQVTILPSFMTPDRRTVPIMVVNPALELCALIRQGGAWRVCPPFLPGLGLRLQYRPDMRTTPMPGARVYLDRPDVTVYIGRDVNLAYQVVGVPDVVHDQIRAYRGALVAYTNAVDPLQCTTANDLVPLVVGDLTLFAWVTLDR